MKADCYADDIDISMNHVKRFGKRRNVKSFSIFCFVFFSIIIFLVYSAVIYYDILNVKINLAFISNINNWYKIHSTNQMVFERNLVSLTLKLLIYYISTIIITFILVWLLQLINSLIDKVICCIFNKLRLWRIKKITHIIATGVNNYLERVKVSFFLLNQIVLVFLIYNIAFIGSLFIVKGFTLLFYSSNAGYQTISDVSNIINFILLITFFPYINQLIVLLFSINNSERDIYLILKFFSSINFWRIIIYIVAVYVNFVYYTTDNSSFESIVTAFIVLAFADNLLYNIYSLATSMSEKKKKKAYNSIVYVKNTFLLIAQQILNSDTNTYNVKKIYLDQSAIMDLFKTSYGKNFLAYLFVLFPDIYINYNSRNILSQKIIKFSHGRLINRYYHIPYNKNETDVSAYSNNKLMERIITLNLYNPKRKQPIYDLMILYIHQLSLLHYIFDLTEIEGNFYEKAIKKKGEEEIGSLKYKDVISMIKNIKEADDYYSANRFTDCVRALDKCKKISKKNDLIKDYLYKEDMDEKSKRLKKFLAKFRKDPLSDEVVYNYRYALELIQNQDTVKGINKLREIVSELEKNKGYFGILLLNKIYAEMADAYLEINNADNSIFYSEKIVNNYKKMNIDMKQLLGADLAYAYNSLGFAYNLKNDEKCIKYYELSLEASKKYSDEINILQTENNLLAAQGKYESK